MNGSVNWSICCLCLGCTPVFLLVVSGRMEVCEARSYCSLGFACVFVVRLFSTHTGQELLSHLWNLPSKLDKWILQLLMFESEHFPIIFCMCCSTTLAVYQQTSHAFQTVLLSLLCEGTGVKKNNFHEAQPTTSLTSAHGWLGEGLRGVFVWMSCKHFLLLTDLICVEASTTIFFSRRKHNLCIK